MNKKHLEELKASLIADEIIANNFDSINREELLQFLTETAISKLGDGKQTPHSDQYATGEVQRILNRYDALTSGGWVFEGIDPQTGKKLGWGCAKPDTPRPKLNEDGTPKTDKQGNPKYHKYEHPEGIPQGVFFCDLGDDNPAWVDAIKHNLDLVITEGAKKAAACQSQGWFTAGVAGITSGYRKIETSAGTKYIPHPLLRPWATQGRTISIALDMDDPSDENLVYKGLLARYRLGKLLTGAGCTVLIPSWSPAWGKGLDDLIATLYRRAEQQSAAGSPISQDPAALLKAILFEDAIPFEQWLEKTGIEQKIQAKAEAWELKQVKEGTLAPEQAEHLDVQDTFQEKAIKDLYNHGGRYLAIDGNLYKYTGTHYELLDPGEEKRRIREWASTYPVLDRKTGSYVFRYMTPGAISSIWDWALLSFGISPDKLNPPGLNLANGTLHITWRGRTPSWELRPHSPDDYFLYCSQVKYDPSASTEHVDRLLECLDSVPRTVLLRTLGASLDLANASKFFSRGVKACILRGAGSNGKDSIRQVVSLIFEDSMCSVDLADFKAYDEGGKKWYLVPLAGAKVNWSSENNKGTSLDGLDSLNLAITRERNSLKKEEKHGKATPFTPNAVHLFNVNRLPHIKTGLDSITSRWAIIDFNKTFKSNPKPERGELLADPRFKEDNDFLTQEVAPAFLNYLLQALADFARQGIDYDSINASLEDIQEESTHLWTLIKDLGITPHPEGRIYVSDLWSQIEGWYQDTDTLEIVDLGDGKTKRIWHEQASKWDVNITGPNQVYKRLKQLFPKISRERDTVNAETKGRWYLTGISFTENTAISASPASQPDSDSVSASPSGSLPFTPASPLLHQGGEQGGESNNPQNLAVNQNAPSGEAESEANREAETPTKSSGEAGEAKHTTPLQAKVSPLEIGAIGILSGSTLIYRKGSTLDPKSHCSEYVERSGTPAAKLWGKSQSIAIEDTNPPLQDGLYEVLAINPRNGHLLVKHQLLGVKLAIDGSKFHPMTLQEVA